MPRDINRPPEWRIFDLLRSQVPFAPAEPDNTVTGGEGFDDGWNQWKRGFQTAPFPPPVGGLREIGPVSGGNPWSSGEARINPTLRPAGMGGGGNPIQRLLSSVPQGPAPQLRGMPGPMRPMPMTPGGPMPQTARPPMDGMGVEGVDTGELERLYAELMRPPSFMERVAQGVQVPNQPMKKRKGRIARTALRGLVEGFKGSQGAGGASRAGGSRGGAAVGPDGLTAYQRASLQFRERADQRAAGASERSATALESLLGAREFGQDMQAKSFDAMRQEKAIDDRRSDQALDISRGHLDISRAQLALARQREARINASAQAALARAGSSIARWPEMWKREFAASMQAINDRDQAAAKAAAEAGVPYDGSVSESAVNQLVQRFVDREIAGGAKPEPTYFDDSRFRGAMGSGGSTTAGQQPQAKGTKKKNDPLGLFK